jgi:glycosyltransferase involved in cell wall biosynthesis
MAQEMMAAPPDGIVFSEVAPTAEAPAYIRSPIKGFLRRFEASEHDVLEAVISPIQTHSRWVYSLACFEEALAFGFFSTTAPRSVRRAYIERLLRRPQLRALLFWSKAGLATLRTYGGVEDERILSKAHVVYPAVACVPEENIVFRDEAKTLLFSGDFFRKGGPAVVDAFGILRQAFPKLTLIVCSDKDIDFNTRDLALRGRYISALERTPGIQWIGRVSRSVMLRDVLPATDVYLIPTYAEAFGFAILEAMSRGVPTVASDVFAIPEMIVDGESGLLVRLGESGVDAKFPGYVIDAMPPKLHEYVVSALVRHVSRLVSDGAFRRRLALGALARVRESFSFEQRNARMADIYRRAAEEA